MLFGPRELVLVRLRQRWRIGTLAGQLGLLLRMGEDTLHALYPASQRLRGSA